MIKKVIQVQHLNWKEKLKWAEKLNKYECKLIILIIPIVKNKVKEVILRTKLEWVNCFKSFIKKFINKNLIFKKLEYIKFL
jgi:hypothetical protein